MGNEKENSRIEEEGFHVNLLLSKSIPVGGKRTLVQEEEESTIHSHLTRVAWLTKYHPSRTPRSNNTRFISRHTFTLLAYPSSRTPVPLSLLPRDSPTAWVRSALLSSISFQSSTSNQRNRRIRCACTRVLLFDSGLFAREGVVFFFFFEVRRSDGWSWNGKGRARRRRWLEWKRDATKTKRRTFNERARDGVADRPRLNRADSEHVGLEWAWLSDGDGRSGSERDGQCSAGGWSGLAEWG